MNRHRGYCPENQIQFQARGRRSHSKTKKEAMAARAEAEEDYHGGYGLPDNGMDVLSDHGHKNYRAEDMGPI